MKLAIWIAIAGLLVLQQAGSWTGWLWNDAALVGGFLPVGLLYQMGVSIASAVVWLVAVQFAWPESSDKPAKKRGGGA